MLLDMSNNTPHRSSLLLTAWPRPQWILVHLALSVELAPYDTIRDQQLVIIHVIQIEMHKLREWHIAINESSKLEARFAGVLTKA